MTAKTWKKALICATQVGGNPTPSHMAFELEG
jgi:hypothetical protein